jgi:HSP20 family molecular chaperone IbpA
MNRDRRSIRVTLGAVPVVTPGPGPEAPPGHPAEMARARTPAIDIHETPNGLVLEADLPGTTEPSLLVQLEDNVLTLEAGVDPGLPEGVKALYLEFLPTPFARSFILSDDVDRSAIAATLNQGVLRLDLPRTERQRTRRIEVKGP